MANIELFESYVELDVSRVLVMCKMSLVTNGNIMWPNTSK